MICVILYTEGNEREETEMTNRAENNIRAMEMLVEELRNELNAAIDEYEEAIEHPENYDIEAAEEAMSNAQRWYDEAKDELESEIAWSKF